MSSRNFRNVPPPSNLNHRTSYARADDVYSRAEAAAASSGVKRFASKFNSEDDYFDQDDDQPTTTSHKHEGEDDEEEEEDPLDAFMADLAKSEKASASTSKSAKKPAETTTLKPSSTSSKLSSTAAEDPKKKNKIGVRHDIEEEDDEESYYRFMKENPNAGVGVLAAGSDDEDLVGGGGVHTEYDDDGNPLPSNAKKLIDPLPMIYHSEINYAPFERNFYTEHAEIKALSSAAVVDLRRRLNLRVSGPSPPRPVTSFAHFGFDEVLMRAIRKLEYTQPTPIQAQVRSSVRFALPISKSISTPPTLQAIPAALSGRDLIGIAKTGSGKTAAFIWPLLVHILDQPALAPGDGPIGVILAPTRELSQQIYAEAKRFAKPYGITVVCAYGGGSKYEQSQDLEAGAEIVVATPVSVLNSTK